MCAEPGTAGAVGSSVFTSYLVFLEVCAMTSLVGCVSYTYFQVYQRVFCGPLFLEVSRRMLAEPSATRLGAPL